VVERRPWIRRDNPSYVIQSDARGLGHITLFEQIGGMGFTDGKVRPSTGENVEVREPSARSASSPPLKQVSRKP